MDEQIRTNDEILRDLCLESLCWYDSRNPNFIEPEFEEDRRTPRNNCACDNCFYGRDKLAMEVLRLTAQLKEVAS